MPRVPRPQMRAMKSAYPAQKTFETVEEFGMALLNDETAPLEAKIRVARALLRVQEPRKAAGKKVARQEAAEAVRGAFELPPPPRKPN
jgi:hypothetical protein